jgi:intracellular sulfur oxidation DsrE/DsrF family protein
MTTVRLRRLAIALVVLLAGSTAVAARASAQSAPDDRAALAGLKEAKVAFDISVGEAARLLSVLNVIDETRESLLRQGVAPRFVLTFRGPATVLIQSDRDKIKPEDREAAAKIVAKLKQLRGATGVEGVEQCSVAMRLTGTRKEHVLPEVTIVGNSWISLIGYQARGYGYIAP